MLALQEMGCMEFEPEPFFGKALATDEEVLKNLEVGRGVGIHSNDQEAIPVLTDSREDEITALIQPW